MITFVRYRLLDMAQAKDKRRYDDKETKKLFFCNHELKRRACQGEKYRIEYNIRRAQAAASTATRSETVP